MPRGGLCQASVPAKKRLTIISYCANYKIDMNDVFKALSDPTRREILELLKARPRTSGEIAEAFPSSWPTISRHLAVLRDAELIVATRDGQHIRYELNTSVVQDVVQRLLGWAGKGTKGRGRRVP